jgi:hypothetical protein
VRLHATTYFHFQWLVGKFVPQFFLHSTFTPQIGISVPTQNRLNGTTGAVLSVHCIPKERKMVSGPVTNDGML